MNKLSNRLQALCQMVDKDTKIIDVGTDHGYVPINLVGEGHIKKAIAADKNKGPLSICEKNISSFSMEDRIKAVLSDGLINVDTDGYDTIIIAGMGGMTIVDILKASTYKLTKTLLLQPQKDAPALRRYIHEIGYRIADEALIYEDMFYYAIIKAEKGEDTLYSDNEYKYSKILIEKKDSTLKQKLSEDMEKLRQLIIRISEYKAERIAQLNKERADIEELIKSLDY